MLTSLVPFKWLRTVSTVTTDKASIMLPKTCIAQHTTGDVSEDNVSSLGAVDYCTEWDVAKDIGYTRAVDYCTEWDVAKDIGYTRVSGVVPGTCINYTVSNTALLPRQHNHEHHAVSHLQHPHIGFC